MANIQTLIDGTIIDADKITHLTTIEYIAGDGTMGKKSYFQFRVGINGAPVGICCNTEEEAQKEHNRLLEMFWRNK